MKRTPLPSFLVVALTLVVTSRVACQGTAQAVDAGPPLLGPVKLTLSGGSFLQIALDREMRLRKVGQPLTGHVIQPVYVFDRLVIPAGLLATGHVLAIGPVPRHTRVLSALNADFTPPHGVTVVFDDLTLPDGHRLRIQSDVKPGSGQIVHLVTTQQKKNAIRQSARTFSAKDERSPSMKAP